MTDSTDLAARRLAEYVRAEKARAALLIAANLLTGKAKRDALAAYYATKPIAKV